jgi:(S)-mandelate dehydrogenase
VADLRRLARKFLPLPVFDYLDGGAENEVAMRHNRAVFERVRFRPRTMVDVSKRSTRTVILGKPAAAPFAIAPMGGLGLFWPRAEIALARACAAAGVPFALSTGSSARIEEVAEAAGDGQLWFQLYVFKDEKMNRALVERAQAAGYAALMVTTDTHMFPKRHRDLRNGFRATLKKTPRNILSVLSRPRWMWKIMIRRGLPAMVNLATAADRPIDRVSAAGYFSTERRASFDYEHLKELRRRWKGPLLVKGVLRADEAIQISNCGADGVILSNHGGRNLESAAAPLEVLPEIVDAVGKRMSVLIDSGFRSGNDIVKALALGAEAVLLGRAGAYAVAAGGEAGVGHLLDLMRDEVDRTLGYLGCTAVDQLGRDHLLLDRLLPGSDASTTPAM